MYRHDGTHSQRAAQTVHHFNTAQIGGFFFRHCRAGIVGLAGIIHVAAGDGGCSDCAGCSGTAVQEVPEEVMSAVVAGAEVFIPLDDIMDYDAEYDRLTKEKKKLEGEVKRVVGKLSNEGFVSKAPEKVINEEREKMVKYKEMLEKVTDRLAMIGAKIGK